MKKILLLFTIALISLNCAAVNTEEKLIWDANNKIENIVFVLENFRYYKNAEEYLNGVKSSFDARNIKNEGFNFDERILNVENKLKSRITEVKPKFILTIALSAIYKGNGKSYTIEIFDTEKQKNVWDGYFFGSGFEGPKGFSKNLMNELEKNKIILPIKE